MQLHEIKTTYKRKARKRVGRGGKRGTYSGRGIKGQRSRESLNLNPVIRGLIKRYPKLRGYRFKSRKTDCAVVNIELLEKKFQAGEVVNPETLLKNKLIRRMKGKTPCVKILAKGKITKNLVVENCRLSQSAKDAIEKAHGMVK